MSIPARRIAITATIALGLMGFNAVTNRGSGEYTNNKGYTELARKPFIKSFIDGGKDQTQETYCKCTFNYLDSHTTDDEFRELDRKAAANEEVFTEQIIIDAVDECTPLIN